MRTTRTKMVLVVVVASLGCALAACGKSEPAGESKPPAPAKEASKPQRVDAAPETPAGAFDTEAFCAQVFAPDQVMKIVGVDGLAPGRAGNVPAGMAECKLEKLDDKGFPLASASALFDCRGLSLDVAKHRDMAKQIAASRKGDYREVALGKGGAYSMVMVAKKPTHTVTWVHAVVPCSITASTAFVEADHAEALAALVNDRLGEENRPRR